ncbi:TPA: siroheme synthase [Vibrio vulnificus]|uniref:precorrin-2 dehydrogenase/sirohydrochlorin ferrochelatase family protein n=1 Tax=Vibrio vulnificus TaxID=672 RepID=UPI000A2029C8|nr:bifunctional precorrin-2 dehydrogenase/sirohydrochlorin ferrochelatase [Vibrio vulnificus]ARN65816.1 Siroheme synthase / Precorrin-2 oxidase / Sirohydrochlorin ferrochelatase [Vibrio vulnificus]EHZ7343869.1 siroheme synthase [Vibrio vulnificus]EID4424358.1 siroheme synthase [Vibrio vulnificus]ELE1961453.1 siroheme synthase [Vibrio vulnificus]ELL0598089.1 siroheme synthase [Vibrio vulnificus]
MRYFPLFMDLENKPVLVVGGGEVASRKIEALLNVGAKVTIVSPTLVDELHRWVEENRCYWVKNFYSSELMDGAYVQVWATTNNPSLNHQVYRDAKQRNLLVNVVDDKPYCDFITPSMISRGRVQIAISSGGASPVLIRNLRESLEAVLPQNLSLLAEFAESKRVAIKERFPTVEERRMFWELFFDLPEVKSSQNHRELETLFAQAIKGEVQRTAQCTWIGCTEDVELLPIKALRYMQKAELVLAPEQIHPAFLEMVRRDAQRLSYETPAQLSEKIQQAKLEPIKICVLFAKNSQEFSFLQQGDLII